jgi:hypothetical protein
MSSSGQDTGPADRATDILRMTAHLRSVLVVLLANPGAWHYGLNVAHRARLKPTSSVYPILRRLRAIGWLCEREEPADSRRPKRRYYRLTDQGTVAARVAVGQAVLMPAVLRSPPPGIRETTPWLVSW